ncbi:MAG: hypothetical protein M1832_002914 [Thelocarpon impressellum]|nr:MAG: hypothetical protein M1832_002914 [Thelocarpon impressellum]
MEDLAKSLGQPGKAGPLQDSCINTLPPAAIGPDSSPESFPQEASSKYLQTERKTPRRVAKRLVNYRESLVSLGTDSAGDYDEGESLNSLADFIVDDDASVGELESPSSTKFRRRRLFSSDKSKTRSASPAESQHPDSERSLRLVEDPRCRRSSQNGTPGGSQEVSEAGSSDSEEPVAVLKFSPRQRSPSKTESETFATPPQSPPRDKPESPTKHRRIPSSALRTSVDAFWSQEVINEWNDEHSPRKTPKARARRFVEDSDDELYVDATPGLTPGKRDMKALDARKRFDQSKHATASAFLRELDEQLTAGRIGDMAAPTGGVKITWSKKLNSTAGRANWRREALRNGVSGDHGVATGYRHHASIELAEKVIDDDDRLLNVIAHEFCHLANFMISGIKDRPHGAEFKKWAATTSSLFRARGIKVTTKHTYAIAYKYIWICSSADCGATFKRHSRSIDPARQVCGACRSRLVQTQPRPRNAVTGSGEGKKGPTAYQLFVKSRFRDVQAAHPTLDLGGVMRMLGREYQLLKAAKAAEVAAAAAGAGPLDEADGGGGDEDEADGGGGDEDEAGGGGDEDEAEGGGDEDETDGGGDEDEADGGGDEDEDGILGSGGSDSEDEASTL